MSQIGKEADNQIAEGHAIPSSLWGDVIAADEESIKLNLLEIQKQIAPCKPKIIGVTKYFGLDAMIRGYGAGLRDFGESRVTDAIKKIEALPDEIRKNSKFHFIGHLQTNKVGKAVKYFDYIQSVDSLKLAEAISEVASNLGKREKILLQINVSGEIQKFGYESEQLKIDMAEILNLKSVEVIGLMCMAPLGAAEAELRKIFHQLRKLRDDLEKQYNVKLPELSMGMSDDYLIALQEGATMIRLGRKLFK